MRKLLLLAACLGLLVVAAGGADAAEAPRPWREHLAMHMKTPKVNTPTEVAPVLDKRRDEIRAGWEKWQRDWKSHLAYEEALRATEILEETETSESTVEPVFAPTASGGVDWYAIAECESGGDWHIVSPPYYGGLQFLTSTWLAYGGGDYAPRADLATPSQQIAVASGMSLSHWPACGAHG